MKTLHTLLSLCLALLLQSFAFAALPCNPSLAKPDGFDALSTAPLLSDRGLQVQLFGELGQAEEITVNGQVWHVLGRPALGCVQIYPAGRHIFELTPERLENLPFVIDAAGFHVFGRQLTPISISQVVGNGGTVYFLIYFPTK